MASGINTAAYSDALIVLGTAGIVVPMVHRLGLSPVLGYLGAGALLGPLGLGTFVRDLPLLQWLTIADAKNVAGIADLGVVFLLFLIGLELSYERLRVMRRLVFGLGTLQIVLTTALLSLAIAAMGVGAPIAVMIAALLALSSTAIVLEELSRQGRMATTTGRASFSVLLAQDIAVVPILMYVSILGANAGSSLLQSVGLALLQAAAALAIIVGIGRALLRPLFRLVASARSSELFIAAILFVIVATGLIAALAGLSMALGAFVAGLLLAETEYRKAIEAAIDPVRGLLLGIFFFTVGMHIDLREIIRAPALLLLGTLGLIAIKAVIMVGLARLYRLPNAASVESGLLLGPGGEFAFVGLALAGSYALITPTTQSFLLALVALSMASIPLLALLARRLQHRLEPAAPPSPALMLVPEQRRQHAIVVGHGRVGKVVSKLLARHEVPFIATDHNATSVAESRKKGDEVYFGDASDAAFLRACGIMEASGVIVTIHTPAIIDAIVAEVRRLRPDIVIVSRARDAAHARHLYAIGVTDAVPETIEASLQLSEAALVGLGIPTGPVIASIHDQRDVFRKDLQQAAGAAKAAAGG